MKTLINGYISSCTMVKKRIGELLLQRKQLNQQGKADIIIELDLDRRIRLLYTEHDQMQKIIIHLTSYMKMIGTAENGVIKECQDE